MKAYSGRLLLPSLARDALDKIQATQEARLEPPNNWQDWLKKYFPFAVTAPFAPRHGEFWEWAWNIQPGVNGAFVSIWPRGGAKSTNAELATVYVGAEDKRPYAWYCSETQEQADKHLESIVEMVEASRLHESYPKFSTPRIGKHGSAKAWRRNRIWTESGFTLDAIGLDTAVRGSRVAENRPGLIVLDDLDGKLDSPRTTAKKIEVMTTSVLPAGSTDLVVIAVQNLIHQNSIFSQIADGRAEFLYERVLSGPFPAIDGLAYERKDDGGYRITGGTPTWEGQNIEICEQQINQWGLIAFLQEAQHEVDITLGGMFDHIEFDHCTWDEVPPLVRVVVWVDPAVTSTDQSDSMAIQADGIDENGRIFRLWSWEQITSPEDCLTRAIRKAIELKAELVGVETDQGGDTWESVYREACRNFSWLQGQNPPRFAQAKAGAGHGPKAHRAGQMLFDYEQGRITHVIGTHNILERALRRFPAVKPFDLVDASYWGWYDLRGRQPGIPLPVNEIQGQSRWTPTKQPDAPPPINRQSETQKNTRGKLTTGSRWRR